MSGTGPVKHNFRGEDHGSRSLRSPKVRGCPVCLREDHLDKAGKPSENMIVRGHWQLGSVSNCIQHSHPLIVLWEATSLMARYDYQARIEEIAPRIMSGALVQAPCAITEFDLWLDERLDTGKDNSWLATQPLYPTLVFCRLLGSELVRIEQGRSDTSTVSLSEIDNAGFKVIRNGKAAIKAALLEMSKATEYGLGDKKATYGILYDRFDELYCTNPAFKTYQSIFRETLLEVWDFAEGEIVLGEPVENRKLHSLTSAALQTGLRPKLLEAFLIHAGALQKGDDRSSLRKTFDADKYAYLLEEAPKLRVLNDLMKELGATKNEIKRLVSEGHLVPRTNDEAIRRKWNLEEALEFLEKLQMNAIPLQASEGWENLLASSNRTKLSLTYLIDLIYSKSLKVGRVTGGFTGLVVNKAEVDGFRGSNHL